MMIKFLNFGVGLGVQAADYMLARYDANGDERKEVRVLRGSPLLVGSIVDSLKFVWRYTSGVISWHLDDNPSDRDMQNVLNDMEALSFAGLEKSQYIYSAVLHVSQDDSKHIHWFTPRVDLESGKHFNSAPPFHLSTFDSICDKHNYGRGWARPGDMLRSRLFHPGPLWVERARKSRMISRADAASRELSGIGDFSSALMAEADSRQVLEELVLSLIFITKVKDYDDLVMALDEWVDITQASDKRLSVKIRGSNQSIKLSGEVFRKTVDYEVVRSNAQDPANVGLPLRAYKDKPANVVDINRSEYAKAKVDRHMCIRSTYNKEHYPAPRFRHNSSPIPSTENSETLKADEENLVLKVFPPNFHAVDLQSYQEALDYLANLLSEESFTYINRPVELDYANDERIRNCSYQDIELTTRRAHEANASLSAAARSIRKTDEQLDIAAKRLPESNALLGKGSRAIDWCLNQIDSACRRVDELLGRAWKPVMRTPHKRETRSR
jgi:hypothetical protein